MIVKEARFKDVPALELITKNSIATVLPSEGGKIASFKDRAYGKEYLLQNPSKNFLHTGLGDEFVDGECCGFDDMFPTIDPVSVTYPDGNTLDYPDHGEVARVPFSYRATENSLVMHFSSSALGYEYEKSFSEDDDGTLLISYRIENRSNYDLDVLWAAHCLINAERGGQLQLPFEDGEPMDVMFDTISRFTAGKTLPFAKKYLVTDWEEGYPECRKFYFPRKAPEGKLAYHYPAGDALVMSFDTAKTPCIGVWLNYGHINGAYCIGLEPATVGYDTVKNAEAHQQKSPIKKDECLNFFIGLSVYTPKAKKFNKGDK